jgi:hypothetical protein
VGRRGLDAPGGSQWQLAAHRRSLIAPLVREWLAELRVMGRSEQTLVWYRQKMDSYLKREGGPATLDGLTTDEIKRLLGHLIDRNLAPNTIYGFFEVVRAFANWALREGFPVDPAVVRMRPPKGARDLQPDPAGGHAGRRGARLARACRADPARHRHAGGRAGGPGRRGVGRQNSSRRDRRPCHDARTNQSPCLHTCQTFSQTARPHSREPAFAAATPCRAPFPSSP